MKTVLSAIQPTADSFHLGNLLGALRQWVDLQQDHRCFFFVADQHALTLHPDPAVLRRRTLLSAAQLLAVGLDPSCSSVFVQSQVPEHAQLGWLLTCLTGLGDATRMTQYKDKGQRAGANLGLLAYPVLQAADVLLYDTDRVPVGADQRQHLELTRRLAVRLRSRLGPVVTVPETVTLSGADRIRDLADPSLKMSKSRGDAGTLYLLDPPDTLAMKVRAARTDARAAVDAGELSAGTRNLLQILASFRGSDPKAEADLWDGRPYSSLKSDVADAVVSAVSPVQDRVRELLEDSAVLEDVLAGGAERARATAGATYRRVAEASGLSKPL